MKIIVLGAGIIGVTTAYILGRAGHEVVVLDRANAVASETSHANGAQLAYSYAEPFAAPGTLKKIPGYLMGRDAGISMRMTTSSDFYRWGFDFIRNCTSAKEQSNLHAMLGLAAKSCRAMEKLSAELPDATVSSNPSGKLILARAEDELKAYGALTDMKQSYGLPVETIDKQTCLDLEPALANWRGNFCGALYAKGDSVLEPVAFCQALQKASVDNYAVTYKFGHDILRLKTKFGRVIGVVTDKGEIACDAVVLCLGNNANSFLKPLGDKQNIYPMQGYSLTLPIGTAPPSISITDPKNKFVIANLGDRIRIAGLLDANLPDADIEKRGQHLLELAKKFWPEAADYPAGENLWADGNLWSGRRPMTPSSLPIVRAGKISGLYYNIGHGSLGLTLAAGCAEIIAGLIAKA